VPAVKVTHSFTSNGTALSGISTAIQSTSAAPALDNTHDGWIYNTTTGDVWVNNNQTDSKGTAYSSYGYN